MLLSLIATITPTPIVRARQDGDKKVKVECTVSRLVSLDTRRMLPEL